MAVVGELTLRATVNEANPDDWRPNSRAALVSDPVASMAVAVQEVAVGDGIPLHVHRIDEVFFFDAGMAEFRLGEETHRIVAGTIVFAPAGVPHATRNIGEEIVRFRAVFPSHVVDLQYLERNPAPGTEGNPPQPGIAYDVRAGRVTALEPGDPDT